MRIPKEIQKEITRFCCIFIISLAKALWGHVYPNIVKQWTGSNFLEIQANSTRSIQVQCFIWPESSFVIPAHSEPARGWDSKAATSRYRWAAWCRQGRTCHWLQLSEQTKDNGLRIRKAKCTCFKRIVFGVFLVLIFCFGVYWVFFFFFFFFCSSIISFHSGAGSGGRNVKNRW